MSGTTPPRSDLPAVGDVIAFLPANYTWTFPTRYIGALTVLGVDVERRQVEVRPEYTEVPSTMLLDGKLDDLAWNLVSGLSPFEQSGIRTSPDPADLERIENAWKNGLTFTAYG